MEQIKTQVYKNWKNISEKERKNLDNLIKEYRDVLAFTYDEIKAYREDVFQHAIPLKEEMRKVKHFHQKLRQINPKLAPIVQNELQKMLAAGIIAPTWNSSWCSNLVVVRKKNRSIRICIDFMNLNISCLKDNYPFPNMETLLQRVIGSRMMSMLDGFYGYNQELVEKEDQHKTTFTTPWGTYKFLRMPFVLVNAGATSQRAMEFALTNSLEKLLKYIKMI